MRNIFVACGVTALALAAGGRAFAEDASEPNNTAIDAVSVGRVGVLRSDLFLEVLDEDWFRVDVPAAVASLTVEVAYEADLYDTQFTLEVTSAAGATLALGAPVGEAGLVRAVTGPVAAGTCLVRLRHDAGGALGAYSLHVAPPDDAHEPNATPETASVLTLAGSVRPNLVLLRGDTDWYRFTLPAPVSAYHVDMTWDRAAYPVGAALELRTAAGAFVADGSAATTASPIRITTGALAAGDYLVGVAHTGGGAVASYALQGYETFGFSMAATVEGSAGANLEAAFSVTGGVAPYTVAIDSRFAAPPGLAFDLGASVLEGYPAVAGRYDVMVTAKDAATPPNSVSLPVSIVINAALDLRVGRYLAFAQDRAAKQHVPVAGGTAPLAFAVTEGSLPAGLSLTTAGAFAGTADEPGSALVTLRGTDAEGLTDTVTTRAVVCEPLGSMHLASGEAACGLWFDAVRGSTVSVTVKTAKGSPRRALSGVLLGVDGTTEVAAKMKSGTGKLSIAGFVAPATGRYYLVVAAPAGEATELVTSAKLAPPTRGSGRVDAFSAGDVHEVAFGAIAGTTLTFTAKPDASGLEVRIQALVSPTGAQVAIPAGALSAKGGAVTLTSELALSGTWKVLVLASRAGPGRMTYQYTLRAPRGAAYAMEE